MNIYEKLQVCRVELQEMNLKKSGENKFAKYRYYELADFMPAVNHLFRIHKLCSIVSFGEDEATLRVVNTEKPEEEILFHSPMAEANLKGCHPIQNLGAVQSYQRRYLYMAALEISEADALDATTGKEDSTPAPKKSAPSKKTWPPKENVTNVSTSAQQKAIYAIAKKMGWKEAATKKQLKKRFEVGSTKELTKKQASQVIEELKRWEEVFEIADGQISILKTVRESLGGKYFDELNEEEYADMKSYAEGLV